MKLTKRKSTREKGKRVTVLVCPHCGGTNIGFGSGFRPSGSYECYDCYYRGGFIIRREVTVDEEGQAEVVAEALLPED